MLVCSARARANRLDEAVALRGDLQRRGDRSIPRVESAGSRSASASLEPFRPELAQDLEHAESLAAASLRSLEHGLLDEFARAEQGPTPVQCRIAADHPARRRSRTRRQRRRVAPTGVAHRARGAGSSSRSSPPSSAGAADRLRSPGPEDCIFAPEASRQARSMPSASSRTAASSSASGSPSSSRQSSSTAGALFASSVKPPPRAAARSTNSETASDRHASVDELSSGSGIDIGGTCSTTSPAMPSAWRLVARIVDVRAARAATCRQGPRPPRGRARSCRGRAGFGFSARCSLEHRAAVHGADAVLEAERRGDRRRDVACDGILDRRERDEPDAIGIVRARGREPSAAPAGSCRRRQAR